ncbi:class II fructose-bisphosphate aldolase [Thermanaerovibrio acidaminovorans]|jgi:fructose/tagatose bisphosphate aldolase|uniref:Ketose-bisphosphate aldolase class-II n=1 Tax=Thermanaerovibrio acidaminovorans (strain ATCC 49978 / DSM 6589 / Su883) TaxID=525903 RepID=D1B854_THEAS|nr:class II fructose-bisphosphate aldolase [Thermanaerovibrio acidaminovorans]ACZ18457.1 ketose-bisphosphate aldolase class-II [Thermanaerovibrio acidaminovorans DSM 6589]
MLDVNSGSYRELMRRRPLNVQARFGGEDVALVSGRDVAGAMGEAGAIALAANARNALVIKGVLKAAKRCSAAVYIELAKSESTYCGANYENIPEYAARYSAELGHGVVFALHVDHYGIKGEEDVLKGVSHLQHIISRGFTSVALDASHLPDYQNLCATRDLADWIPSGLGLEVEVGEIKGAGELSTVEEALYFIGGLNAWGVFPDYLAISNGSLHGTYDSSAGVVEGIDLGRTKEIADAIAPYGVAIAQHGISGTPLDKVKAFRSYGIRKGNVATLFQNVVFGLEMDPDTGNAVIRDGSYVKDPSRGVSKALWDRMVEWCDSKGMSRKSGDYKKLNLPFHDAIMEESEDIRDRIVDEVAWWAERFMKAFGAEGTAEKVMEIALRRRDHNASPERKVLGCRADFGPEKAPNSTKSSNGDYSD